MINGDHGTNDDVNGTATLQDHKRWFYDLIRWGSWWANMSLTLTPYFLYEERSIVVGD